MCTATPDLLHVNTAQPVCRVCMCIYIQEICNAQGRQWRRRFQSKSLHVFPSQHLCFLWRESCNSSPLFVDWFAGCRTLPLNIIMQMTCDYSLIWRLDEWEHTIVKWQPLWQAPPTEYMGGFDSLITVCHEIFRMCTASVLCFHFVHKGLKNR